MNQIKDTKTFSIKATGEESSYFDPKKVGQAVSLIRALANLPRLRIIDFFQKKEEKHSTVQPVYDTLKTEQSATSTHLATLKDAGVFTAEHDGRHEEYYLNNKMLEKVETAIKNFFAHYLSEEKQKGVCLNYEYLRKVVLVLRAIKEKRRREMVDLLIEENTSIKVTDIYIKLRIEQSVASNDLKFLRGAGIVSSCKKGKNVLYVINLEGLEWVSNLIEDLTC